MREAAIRIGAIVHRDAVLALRSPLGLLTKLVSPAIAIVGFHFVARLVDPHNSLSVEGRHAGYFAYVSVNLIFMLLITEALQAVAQAMRYDQLVGTLEPVFATSISTSLYAAGCALWRIVYSGLQVAFCLGFAALVFGLDLRAIDMTSLATLIVLSILTMGAIGIVSAAGVIAFRAVPPSNYLVGGAASLLAGTLFPTRLFPPALRVLSWCLPLTHALRGLRAAVAGETLGAIAADAVWLGVAAAILVPLSLAALHFAVARARCDGTLAHY